MSALLKRIRDAIWPENIAAQSGITRAFADDLEHILPGQMLVITVRGRRYAIVEEEEMDLVLKHGGFKVVERS